MSLTEKFIYHVYMFSPLAESLVTFRIRPLQLAVTWYKIHLAGEQAKHWGIQNKENNSSVAGGSRLVSDVPVRNFQQGEFCTMILSEMLTHICCSQGVVRRGSSSHTWRFSFFPSPVEVVCACRLSPTLVAITLKSTIRATRKLIRIITTVIFEVTYLSLVDTSEILTHILL